MNVNLITSIRVYTRENEEREAQELCRRPYARATFLERHLRHSDSEKRSKVIYHALSGD